MYRQDKMAARGLRPLYRFNQDVMESGGNLQFVYKGIASLLSRIFIAYIYMFVCLKALGGAFGVGNIAQYITSILGLSKAIQGILATYGELKINNNYLLKVFEYLDCPNNMKNGTCSLPKAEDYTIEFVDVSFKYPNTDTYVLKHINVKIKKGEHIAIVGMNGSGKTTFIKLLCRLYNPTEGKILLNGVDICTYDYTEYLSMLAVVFQDFNIFSFALGQNVATSVTYDEKKAMDVLTKAGFGERLSRMEKGLDTCLYHNFDKAGVEISGGEAQKIALARALYKESEMVILDEPTAALDPIAEAEVYSSFNQIVGEKTAIYISHRLATCRFCERVLVFDAGEIIQSGTHEQLLEDVNGQYYILWTTQAQFYQDA